MANTRIVFHIGLHKTGSSAIQEFLSNNTPILDANCAVYPARLSSLPAHQELAWCLMKKSPTWADKNYLAKDVLTYYKQLAAECTQPTMILSSEDLSLLDSDPTSIEQLHDEFADHEMTVLVYLRPQIDFLISVYHHLVREFNEQRTFVEYFEQTMRLRAVVQYERRLAVWKRFFSSEQLVLRHYDRACRCEQGIVQDFFEAIGLDVPFDAVAPKANLGIHPYLCEAYRYLNGLSTRGHDVTKHK